MPTESLVRNRSAQRYPLVRSVLPLQSDRETKVTGPSLRPRSRVVAVEQPLLNVRKPERQATPLLPGRATGAMHGVRFDKPMLGGKLRRCRQGHNSIAAHEGHSKLTDHLARLKIALNMSGARLQGSGIIREAHTLFIWWKCDGIFKGHAKTL